MNLNKLKRRVAAAYDPDYLVDVLQITSEELVEVFETYLVAAYDNGEFADFGDD